MSLIRWQPQSGCASLSMRMVRRVTSGSRRPGRRALGLVHQPGRPLRRRTSSSRRRACAWRRPTSGAKSPAGSPLRRQASRIEQPLLGRELRLRRRQPIRGRATPTTPARQRRPQAIRGGRRGGGLRSGPATPGLRSAPRPARAIPLGRVTLVKPIQPFFGHDRPLPGEHARHRGGAFHPPISAIQAASISGRRTESVREGIRWILACEGEPPAEVQNAKNKSPR